MAFPPCLDSFLNKVQNIGRVFHVQITINPKNVGQGVRKLSQMNDYRPHILISLRQMICGDVPENMMSALKLMPPMRTRRSAPTTNAFGICPYSKYSMMLNIKGITIPRMTTRPQKYGLSIPDVNIVAETAASVDLVKDMNTRSIKNRASTERNITCPSAKLDKVLIVLRQLWPPGSLPQPAPLILRKRGTAQA